MVRVFKCKWILGQLNEDELTSLVNEFKGYKQSNVAPLSFGRDAHYDHPNNLPIIQKEEVQHIHLADPAHPWPSYKVQFYKTSDTHLVYCQGVNHPEHYALLAILSPDAHEQARNNDIMYRLGKMAELFRTQH